MILDSEKCFWILGRVFGFWDVFLDSGTCFGFWEVFWILCQLFHLSRAAYIRASETVQCLDYELYSEFTQEREKKLPFQSFQNPLNGWEIFPF